MKQILQNLKTGSTGVVEVPCPDVGHGEVLIRTTNSLISAGTERMLINFGKANSISKARQQPDKLRLVLDKVKTDGLMPTLNAVQNKLEQPIALGYCNVGKVLDFGPGVKDYSIGDRVASNGNHAEIVSVPQNLCAPVPDSVTDEQAAFTVIGAIALQGIRLLKPTLGEAVVVTGLGLIGQVAVQLLRASGCRVLGIDFDPVKLNLAKSFGAEVVSLATGEDPVLAAQRFSRGRGVDAVLVTAATKSSEPMHQAATMCRKRGRIVLVGVTGLELSRDDFFKKELSFQVSASYGPGRYDVDYEEKGRDYPVGFVRWTGQRNFEAVLDMLADGRLNIDPLISHRFRFEEVGKSYAVVAGSEPSMGILLQYSNSEKSPDILLRESIEILAPRSQLTLEKKVTRPVLGFIGSGNYASSILIPAFKQADVYLKSVASRTGVTSVHAGTKYGFDETTTDAGRLISDQHIDAVVIATRHNNHARFVLQALKAGKHVFVEKPLCITLSELQEIEASYRDLVEQERAPTLMVGFNRRFAPQVQKVKSLLAGVSGPKSFIMTVNAGAIPSQHWTQDVDVGGGRIIGEACHFIDLLRFLADSPIAGYSCMTMDTSNDDTVSLQLSFADGSIGTVHYFANGCKAFPKERLEVFASDKVLQLDNFRKLTGYRWPGFSRMNLWRQDKGQYACAAAFVNAIRCVGIAPVSFAEIIEVSRVSILLASGSAKTDAG